MLSNGYIIVLTIPVLSIAFLCLSGFSNGAMQFKHLLSTTNTTLGEAKMHGWTCSHCHDSNKELIFDDPSKKAKEASASPVSIHINLTVHGEKNSSSVVPITHQGPRRILLERIENQIKQINDCNKMVRNLSDYTSLLKNLNDECAIESYLKMIQLDESCMRRISDIQAKCSQSIVEYDRTKEDVAFWMNQSTICSKSSEFFFNELQQCKTNISELSYALNRSNGLKLTAQTTIKDLEAANGKVSSLEKKLSKVEQELSKKYLVDIEIDQNPSLSKGSVFLYSMLLLLLGYFIRECKMKAAENDFYSGSDGDSAIEQLKSAEEVEDSEKSESDEVSNEIVHQGSVQFGQIDFSASGDNEVVDLKNENILLKRQIANLSLEIIKVENELSNAQNEKSVFEVRRSELSDRVNELQRDLESCNALLKLKQEESIRLTDELQSAKFLVEENKQQVNNLSKRFEEALISHDKAIRELQMQLETATRLFNSSQAEVLEGRSRLEMLEKDIMATKFLADQQQQAVQRELDAALEDRRHLQEDLRQRVKDVQQLEAKLAEESLSREQLRNLLDKAKFDFDNLKNAHQSNQVSWQERLETELILYESAKKDLEHLLDTAKTDIANLKDEHEKDELSWQEQLKNERNSLDSTKKNLELQLKDLSQLLDTNSRRYTDDIEGLQREVDTLTYSLNSTRAELQSKSARVEALQLELDKRSQNTEKDFMELQAQLDGALLNAVVLGEDILIRDEQIRKLREELLAASDSSSKLQSQLEVAISENETLKASAVEALNRTVENLRTEFETKLEIQTAATRNAEERSTGLIHQLSICESALTEKNLAIQSKVVLVEELRERIQFLGEEKSTEAESYRLKLESQRSALSQSQNELKKSNEELDKVKQDLAASMLANEEHTKQLNDQFEGLRAALRALMDEDALKYNAKIISLENDLLSKDGDIVRICKERDDEILRLRNELDAISTDCEIYQQSLTAKEEELQSTMITYLKLSDDLRALTETIHEKQAENIELQQSKESLEAEVVGLEAEIKSLTQQLLDRDRTLSYLQAEYQTCRVNVSEVLKNAQNVEARAQALLADLRDSYERHCDVLRQFDEDCIGPRLSYDSCEEVFAANNPMYFSTDSQESQVSGLTSDDTGCSHRNSFADVQSEVVSALQKVQLIPNQLTSIEFHTTLLQRYLDAQIATQKQLADSHAERVNDLEKLIAEAEKRLRDDNSIMAQMLSKFVHYDN